MRNAFRCAVSLVLVLVLIPLYLIHTRLTSWHTPSSALLPTQTGDDALDVANAVLNEYIKEGAIINFHACYNSAGIRSACASDRFLPGSLVMQLPRSTLWTFETLHSTAVFEALRPLFRANRGDAQSSAKFLANFWCSAVSLHILNSITSPTQSSKLDKQIQFLKTISNTSALLWSPDKLEGSDHTVQKLTKSFKNALIQHYYTAQGYLSDAQLPTPSVDDFLWAASLCHSRTWSSDSQHHLPFLSLGALDLLNHRCPRDAVSIQRAAGEASDIVVFARNDVKKGEEVFNYYGEKTREAYIVAYGFEPERCPKGHQSEIFSNPAKEI